MSSYCIRIFSRSGKQGKIQCGYTYDDAMDDAKTSARRAGKNVSVWERAGGRTRHVVTCSPSSCSRDLSGAKKRRRRRRK